MLYRPYTYANPYTYTPKHIVFEIVGYLKRKSYLMIFHWHANIKYKYGNRTFLVQRVLYRYSWEEIRDRYKNISIIDLRKIWQLINIILSEYIDLFTGEKEK